MEHSPQQTPDLSEKGRGGQSMDRRLFMQLLVFGQCIETQPLIDSLEWAEDIEAVLYYDVNDPYGVGLLTMSEDPSFFTDRLRHFLQGEVFRNLALKHEYTMFGRTYALGYEENLQETLFDRPRRTALNPDWPWAIWYPLRRSGEFERLDEDQQREILMEHGRIGFSFGRGDLAHDIRLDCHGLDKHDNDFVVALAGRELQPLSAVVTAMRKTTQTSLYLEHLGPFFVGKVAWQSRLATEQAEAE